MLYCKPFRTLTQALLGLACYANVGRSYRDVTGCDVGPAATTRLGHFRRQPRGQARDASAAERAAPRGTGPRWIAWKRDSHHPREVERSLHVRTLVCGTDGRKKGRKTDSWRFKLSSSSVQLPVGLPLLTWLHVVREAILPWVFDRLQICGCLGTCDCKTCRPI